MLLTITSTTRPATDLGYLLHKHPDRVQSFTSSVGVAHVFYPEATAGRCTAALLLEVDAVGLARGRRTGAQAFALAQYVNDRPYAATSMLSVAMGRVFRTALAGRCEARPDLAATPLDLEIRVPALSSTGGEALVRSMLEPLGWRVDLRTEPLDPEIPRWGGSHVFDVTLSGTVLLREALSHLAVLLPCLDGGKHYWVGDDEVDKLVNGAGSWLGSHPQRETILRRSLAHQRDLVQTAVGRLAAVDDLAPEALDNAVPGALDNAVPRALDNAIPGVLASAVPGAPADAVPVATDPPPSAAPSLAQQRTEAVLAALREEHASRVVDLGCGEGALLRRLLADPAFTEVVGADVSPRALEQATRRLALERMPDSQRARLRLLQSSLMYGDARLAGFDAVVLQEVVEHVDPERLPSLERAVFAVARPRAVVVTTPNRDYNSRYPGLPAGARRHPDHRFEWNRDEFGAWTAEVAGRHGYRVRHAPVGPVDDDLGAPTQLAVFTRDDSGTGSSDD